MNEKNKVPYLLAGLLGGLGIGYICWHQDFQVKNSTISYKGKSERPIMIENNKIKVGDLTQRVEDLLDESPARIRAAIEYNLENYGK